MQEQLILHCENRIDGILTAIYDAFVYKNRMPGPYQDTISIQIGDGGNVNLFAKEIEVATDSIKAEKTVYAIQSKLGYSIYRTIFHALCHYDEERATVVLGYLVRAFAKGRQIQEYMADPYVMRVLELYRKVGNECQKMEGFLRFRDMGEFLYSEIEPKCDDLPIMQDHFADRYPNENFIIYDSKREYALVHPKYQPCFFASREAIADSIKVLTDKTGEDALAAIDHFEALWRRYFSTIAIEARENERCQNNLLPKWYRKNMLEFDLKKNPLHHT